MSLKSCNLLRSRCRSHQHPRLLCRSNHSIDRPQSSPSSVFIWGLNGYTSVGLGNILSSNGWRVTGTYRRPECEALLQRKGWEVARYDPALCSKLSQDAIDLLSKSSHVLSSIPPLGMPLYDPALQEQVDVLKASTSLEWIGYLSSTGVYGDSSGDWVDESSPCWSATSRGLIRRAAEESFEALHTRHGLPVHIFRLGGIYGPRRSALDAAEAQVTCDRSWILESDEPSPVIVFDAQASLSSNTVSESKLRRGKQRFISRCHVLDICKVLEASMKLPTPGRIFNIVDDDPAPRSQVMTLARALLSQRSGREGGSQCDLRSGPDLSLSSEISLGEAGQADSVGNSTERLRAPRQDILEEKRVRNDRIKADLGVRLVYPSYKEGLLALSQGDLRPFTKGDLRSFDPSIGGSTAKSESE